MNIFVVKLGDYDVLLGRGSGPNQYEGNKRFRTLAGYLLQNMDFLSYDKVSRRELSEQLVALVHSKNGRFVRKLSREERFAVACNLLDTSSASSSTDKKKFRQKQQSLKNLYLVVPKSVALEKAKQCIRHQLDLMMVQVNDTHEVCDNLLGSTIGPSFAAAAKKSNKNRDTDKSMNETTVHQGPLKKRSAKIGLDSSDMLCRRRPRQHDGFAFGWFYRQR